MRKKGYVYNMLVFLVFIAAFAVVITSLKSASIMQDSGYERITMMKAANLARNIGELDSTGIDCAELESELDSAELPYEIDVDCEASVVSISSKSGRYSQTVPI